MALPCRIRRSIAAWLAVVLLFAQLATAAYACPRELATDDGQAAAMTAMPGCTGDMGNGLDAEQPLLCKAHCEGPRQSVNAQAGQTETAPAAVLVALLPTPCDPLEALPPRRVLSSVRGGSPPPGAPPLYLSLLALRR